MTVPFFASVTDTGVTVVTSMVACLSCPASTHGRTTLSVDYEAKVSGTSNDFVPSGSRTTSWLPSTLITSKLLV